MINRLLLVLGLIAFTPQMTRAQGTLVFDQESSSDESALSGALPIQAYTSLGQSFTPSLSSLGFIRLRFSDVTPNNALGATLAINLRADSMSGTILGTSAQVVLADGFSGATSFIFGGNIAVTPQATYFFEPVVQSGDNWAIAVLGDTYSGGMAHQNGFPASGNDLWFREGIIIPEPSLAALLGVGSISAWLVSKRQTR